MQLRSRTPRISAVSPVYKSRCQLRHPCACSCIMLKKNTIPRIRQPRASISGRFPPEKLKKGFRYDEIYESNINIFADKRVARFFSKSYSDMRKRLRRKAYGSMQNLLSARYSGRKIKKKNVSHGCHHRNSSVRCRRSGEGDGGNERFKNRCAAESG